MYFELQEFCDASQQAYGACIFLKAINKGTKISSNLICSKSKVAPLNATSLPRLELCGALIPAQLMNKIPRQY
ncbi:Pao retrotransposon peptidase [Popillia japonica]|uniref:Pao retrotransposon peptidase n=1 Tax=Popillia japonica TaxID=7064 RepID=A0AAW1HVR3_POPJA